MFQRILVPLDGSERAEQAVTVAARVARASGGTLLLLQVLSAAVELLPFVAGALEPSTLGADESASMSYLQAVAGLYPDLPTEVTVRTGLVANTITTFAEKSRADAIFMTSHGQTNLVQRLMGSVAERVVHSSSVPILMLREPLPLPPAQEPGGQQPAASASAGNPPEQTAPLRILAPLDGSPEAELALRPIVALAGALCGQGQARLDLVRVVPSGATTEQRATAEQYLQDVITRLRGEPSVPSVTADWAVAEADDPAEMIAIIGSEDEGTPQAYHLVALTTPPSDRVNHWPLGDVLERLLHSTRLSLLLVHPPRQP